MSRFLIVLLLHRLNCEQEHAAGEFLQSIPGWENAIRFVELEEVALDVLTHISRSMLFVDMTFVTPRWICFFGLEHGLEDRLDEAACPCAFAEVEEGKLTPFPQLRHREDLSTTLHPWTIFLRQIEYVLALEVTQAQVTPEKTVYLCCFDIGNE